TRGLRTSCLVKVLFYITTGRAEEDCTLFQQVPGIQGFTPVAITEVPVTDGARVAAAMDNTPLWRSRSNWDGGRAPRSCDMRCPLWPGCYNPACTDGQPPG